MYSGRHSEPDLSGSKAVNSAVNAGWSSMKPVPRDRKVRLSEADCWCKHVEVFSSAMGANRISGAWSDRKVLHITIFFSQRIRKARCSIPDLATTGIAMLPLICSCIIARIQHGKAHAYLPADDSACCTSRMSSSPDLSWSYCTNDFCRWDSKGV